MNNYEERGKKGSEDRSKREGKLPNKNTKTGYEEG